jgi:hypothetical protein
VGRYVESDPIGLRGGINNYEFAKQKPLSEIDLFGLAPDIESSDEPFPFTGRFPPLETDPVSRLLCRLIGIRCATPPTGNIIEGSKPQDGVCSGIGDLIGGNRTDCRKRCCIEHDQCFARNFCNVTSWYTLPFFNSGCSSCNKEAVSCLQKNWTKGDCECS